MKAFIFALLLLFCPLQLLATPIYCKDNKGVIHTMKYNGKNITLDGQHFFFDKEYEVNEKIISLYHADSGQKIRMILIMKGKTPILTLDLYSQNSEQIYTSKCSLF